MPATNITITTEQHFYKKNGVYYVEGNEDYLFFKRYLIKHSTLNVISRCTNVDKIKKTWKIASGENVTFLEISEFKGPLATFFSLFKTIIELNKFIRVNKDSSHILRSPGIISFLTWVLLKKHNTIYGVELVEDPEEAFKKDSYGSSIMIFIKKFFVSAVRSQCKDAYATSYVTKSTLQKKYPPGNERNHFYSSIDLDNSAFNRFKQYSKFIQDTNYNKDTINIVTIGRVHRPYKGIDIMLKSIHELKQKGIKVKFLLIGGGQLLDTYIKMSKELGIEDICEFRGEVKDQNEVHDILQTCHIFALPTRREGLPRSVIEAMAIGLPCLCTPTGGIPELVESEYLFPLDNNEALSNLIIKLLNDKQRVIKTSIQNHNKALEYHKDKLDIKRANFYSEFS